MGQLIELSSGGRELDGRHSWVGPFMVDDLSYPDVVDTVTNLAIRDQGGPVRAYALHVGGLNHRQDADFVNEMRSAEFVYADGGSIVLLAKLAGARHVQRAPTTDLGWDVLRAVGQRLGRPARLALIGGPPGLANRAGAALENGAAGTVVFESDGFQDDWEAVLDTLVAADADICLVGMGAPREMLWIRTWYHRLPHILLLTCGGWFGFLAGDERRAGALLRRSGLEWIARVTQSPRRLGARYARGAVSTGLVAAQTLGERWRRQTKPSSPESLAAWSP
jgi:N-acetylglucosaminyldiphosphoundecaprenol N-acetyl-beta-D-mannosaminyltransferase